MMIQDSIQQLIKGALKELNLPEVDFVIEHPTDFSHGDYASNVAMVLGKQTGKNPRELAEGIVRYIELHKVAEIERVEVAGPGFINFYLSRQFFADSTKEILDTGEKWGSNDLYAGKKVMVEYTDPNPFKEFHIGHLMSNAIGESISRLVQNAGAETHRANYQGDVGVHVAKAVWGKQNNPEMSWGEAYASGAQAYEEHAKEEIDALNKVIYDRSDEAVNELYDEGRKKSLEAFEEIYKKLGTHFDHYFFESEVGPVGLEMVEDHMDVFEKSNGAIVFKAEKYDPKLHTRVFVNAKGIPTYEAKELGLAKKKFETWMHDRSITVTANEIEEYYKVVMKALEQIDKTLAQKIKHISHGFLKLTTGKMSSRTGNVITGESLIVDTQEIVGERMKESEIKNKEEAVEQIAVAAIKYSILKQSIGKDIIFDMEKSLSFEGDSGPYLQYTHTRTVSLLQKAREGASPTHLETRFPSGWEVTDIERLLYRFPEVAERALEEFEPHYVATFLTELAGAFNSWYANERVLDGTDQAPYKLALVEAVGITMKNGLWLLGIKAPEKM